MREYIYIHTCPPTEKHSASSYEPVSPSRPAAAAATSDALDVFTDSTPTKSAAGARTPGRTRTMYVCTLALRCNGRRPPVMSAQTGCGQLCRDDISGCGIAPPPLLLLLLLRRCHASADHRGDEDGQRHLPAETACDLLELGGRTTSVSSIPYDLPELRSIHGARYLRRKSSLYNVYI